MRRYRVAILLVGGLWAIFPGCRAQHTDRLVGTWEGRAETAADRAEADEAARGEKNPQPQQPDEAAEALVYERHPFTLTLSFDAGGTVEMRAQTEKGQEGPQQKQGAWRVVEAIDQQMTLEIKVEPSDATDQPSGGEPEVRRFLLVFRDDGATRFRLTEVGADPKLGAILFQKIEPQEDDADASSETSDAPAGVLDSNQEKI